MAIRIEHFFLYLSKAEELKSVAAMLDEITKIIVNQRVDQFFLLNLASHAK